LRDVLAKQGIVAQPSTPEEMARQLKEQFDAYEKLIRTANIKAG
jgi:hypothetical protein